MKQVLFLILFSFFLFTSCKKDGSSPVNVDTVPSKPILVTPKDAVSNIAEPVVLTWSESSGAKSYTLQVSASSSFSSFVFNKSDITTTSQQITELNYFSVYYWRVSATNSTGTSDWSSVWSFTTSGEGALVPQLSLPANGAVEQSVAPVLAWNKVNNANKYTLQISTNSSFTSFIFNTDTLTATTKQITGLSLVTKYYWRVSAANSFGTKGWSETWSFTTTPTVFTCGTSTIDYSGKTYHTVQIGSQCWLKENLDVGTMIQGSANPSNNGTIEKYCYDNNSANCTTYGGLYQWNEAMQYVTTEKAKGICPTGWHIPTQAEFQTLAAAVGNDGNKLKREDQGTGSGQGTNTSGISALLAGNRYYFGSFYNLGDYTYFWSSTEYNAANAYYMGLWNSGSNINMVSNYKEYGFSIRCLKD